MKALTTDELDRLLNYLRMVSVVLYAACRIGFSQGMRVSEIVGLLRPDIDFTAGTITVRRLKGSLTTTWPIGDDRDALVSALAYSPIPGFTSPYAFVNEDGEPFTRHSFLYRFKKACLAAGIPKDKAHCHSLKHACGFALAEANVSLPILQAYLGHKSMQSTAIYTRPRPETVAALVGKVLCNSHAI